MRKRKRKRREGLAGSNLKSEGAGLSGLGEVFARALLVVCVQLDVREQSDQHQLFSLCMEEVIGREGLREGKLV